MWLVATLLVHTSVPLILLIASIDSLARSRASRAASAWLGATALPGMPQ